MEKKFPRSPFSTPLSGSARDAELRIRSIFQWKKRRPPLVLMALVALLILSCGYLVSCQAREAGPAAPDGDGQAPAPPPMEQLPLLEALYGAVSGQMVFGDSEGPHGLEEAAPQLLCSFSQEGTALAAAAFRDDYASYLVVGAVEEGSGELTGPAYTAAGGGAAIHAVAYRDIYSGQPRLLYTFRAMNQGYLNGEAGEVYLEEGRLAWSWPGVGGDVLEEDSRAALDYEQFWQEHLPLLSPSGLDLFTANPGFGPHEGSPAQWSYDHTDSFWSAPELDLPGGVYKQTRAWLEEFTRDGPNPWDAHNISAAWQIVSITPADGDYLYLLGDPGFTYTGEKDYLLTAREDGGRERHLAARLRYDHGAERVARVMDWDVGSARELGLEPKENATFPLSLADGRTLTLELDEAPVDGGYDNTVVVRQVKVWDGGDLLQTITAGDVLDDGQHLFEGLYRLTDTRDIPGGPDLRDLNGDGSEDLGLLANCGFPHNVNYARFLWDDRAGRLVFSGIFFSTLEPDGEEEAVETEFVSNEPNICRRYTFAPQDSYARYGAPLLIGLDARGYLPPVEKALPIPVQGLDFTFSSGAGAWQTELTLRPDGTFSGVYQDADMGANTRYLCTFEGAFSLLTPLDEHTWSLTLTDLELTLGRPVGEEWVEDGVRCVSSYPYGLDGGNEFTLYLPGAPAAFIPYHCRRWSGGYDLAPGDVLGGYSLCSPRAGYGFFS